MTTTATITYKLSETGRRESLKRGGDGKADQTLAGEVSPESLDLFTVDDQGRAKLALCARGNRSYSLYGGLVSFNGEPETLAGSPLITVGQGEKEPHLYDLKGRLDFDAPFESFDAALAWERERLARVAAEAESVKPLVDAAKAAKAARDAEAQAESSRKRQEQEANYAAARAKEREAAAKAEAALAEWAKANGSELLRARIEEGFTWMSLGRQEYANAVLAAVGLPAGVEAKEGWYDSRSKPALEEIHTLRKIREALGEKGTPSLVWLMVAREFDENDPYGDSTPITPWRASQPGLKVEIPTPDGEEISRLIALADIV